MNALSFLRFLCEFTSNSIPFVSPLEDYAYLGLIHTSECEFHTAEFPNANVLIRVLTSQSCFCSDCFARVKHISTDVNTSCANLWIKIHFAFDGNMNRALASIWLLLGSNTFVECFLPLPAKSQKKKKSLLQKPYRCDRPGEGQSTALYLTV